MRERRSRTLCRRVVAALLAHPNVCLVAISLSRGPPDASSAPHLVGDLGPRPRITIRQPKSPPVPHGPTLPGKPSAGPPIKAPDDAPHLPDGGRTL